MIAIAPHADTFPLLSDAEILSDEPVMDFPIAFFCANGHDFTLTFTDEAEAEMFAVAECPTCTAYAKKEPFLGVESLFVVDGADALTLAKSRRSPEQQEQTLSDALAFASIVAHEEDLPLAS